MKTGRYFVLVLFLFPVLLFGMLLPAQASPAVQVQYATPTPGPDGRIVYQIQPGDTCISVTLKSGITVDQLRLLNPQLDQDCILVVGQELVLGLAGPAVVSPTPGPSPTLEPPTPTPTPPPGTTEICVLLYEDSNGDALRQETELGVAGGAVSVSNTAGTFSETRTTVAEINLDTEEPQQVCFVDVPEGEYNISLAVPDNYNPTMELTYNFTLKAGDRAFVDFGAQPKTETTGPAGETGSEGGTTPVLGILGGLLLIGGLGLGWYAFQQRKPRSRLKGSDFYKYKR